jgi:hypothetical protein
MLTQVEKEALLSNFPQNIKLSYENIVHKKVSNASFAIAIPEGKKYFAWFTQNEKTDQPICYLLELEGSKRQISDIKMVNACFSQNLSYGTILFGTQFHYQRQAYFSVEDVFYYKGKPLSSENYGSKLQILKTMFEKELKQAAYNKNFIVFGLPLIHTNYDELLKLTQEVPYRIYGIQFRNYKKWNQVEQMPFRYTFNPQVSMKEKPIEEKNVIENNNNNNNIPKEKLVYKPTITEKPNRRREYVFKVRPDIQNDIYHLYCTADDSSEHYHDIAYIPDYKTSLQMNRLFRNIKENENLDALEESDDEEEFENEREDRFVFLDREYSMSCYYHYKFKKWIPVRTVSANEKIIHSKELIFTEKNKH